MKILEKMEKSRTLNKTLAKLAYAQKKIKLLSRKLPSKSLRLVMFFKRRRMHFTAKIINRLLRKKIQHNQPNHIWSEAISVLKYILQLSPEDLLQIRMHTGLITGDIPWGFWHQTNVIHAETFAKQCHYIFFTENLPENLHVSEPFNIHIPRPMGITYRSRIINHDTARFQSVIFNLYHTGLLNWLEKLSARPVLLEIGSGYGGLVHHIKNSLKRPSTCIIIDLPEILMFSAAFLITHNPKKSFYFYDANKRPDQLKKLNFAEYDFVFLPHTIMTDYTLLPNVDFAINILSFQEMNATELEKYSQFIANKVTGYFYSDNMDKHPCNNDTQTQVTESLASHLYLSPTPEYYKNQIAESDHPWFYKVYLAKSKLHHDAHTTHLTGHIGFIAGASKTGTQKTANIDL